jgi:HlyD family secretion protein
MPNSLPNPLPNPLPENLPIIAPAQVAFYKRPVVWGIVGLALMVAGGAIYLRIQSKTIPTVVVETATLGPVTRVLAVNGKIAAQDEVQIRATVSGLVLALMAGEGDLVAKGAVLAQIDNSQQQAIVQQALSDLQHGKTLAAAADASYQRFAALGPVISKSVLQEAQSNLEGANQEVARLTALWDQSVIQLSRYEVTAPLAGTILLRSVQLGQLADTATPLFTLADLSVLTVETNVDEAYGAQIMLGQAVSLQLVGNRAILAGKVNFASPRIDAATGGRAVKIGFATPLSAPVGMTVTANIIVDQRDALTVPRAALRDDAVFLRVGKQAKLTPVTVIDWPAARLIVTAGLTAGDQVITDATGLIDGQAVN